MRWRGRRRSQNIEDRRGMSNSPRGRMGRGRMRLGRRSAGGGIGTIVLVLVAMYFGIDPSVVLQGLESASGPSVSSSNTTRATSAQEDQMKEFTAVVLADTEDSWNELFAEDNRQYIEPTLVTFSGVVNSACGTAQSAVGPFYCPADQKVYIDLSFYNDMRDRYGASGDFAQAYVIAHEVGHHVQNLLGIASRLRQAQPSASQIEANKLSVRMELQADCLAGLWARHADRAKNILEAGDLEEALAAAAAIGDDRLQQQSRGHVSPDSFTHGTSDQRVRWFKRGLGSSNVEDCDSFSARSL